MLRQILLLIASTSGSAWAAGPSYSPHELLKRAMERNAELKALKLDSSAMHSRASQSAKWNDPVLEAWYEKLEEPQGTTQFSKFGLSQQIPRPGLMDAREQMAKGAAKKSELDLAVFESRLQARILELIYAYRVAGEKALHAKERVDRLKTVEIYLKSRTFAAPQKKAETMIVKSKALILQRELRTQESDRAMAWNNLNLYLGFEAEPSIAVSWYKSPREFKLEDLTQKLEAGNPELKRGKIELDQRAGEWRLARAEGWPGLTLAATYSNGTGESPEKTYGVGIEFPLPLLNGNRGGIRAAELASTAQEARLTWARSSLLTQLKSTFEKYQAAGRSLGELAYEKIAIQEKEIHQIDAGFKKGQIDLITFLEADSQHADSLNVILDAQVSYLSALNELLLMVGEVPLPLEK